VTRQRKTPGRDDGRPAAKPSNGTGRACPIVSTAALSCLPLQMPQRLACGIRDDGHEQPANQAAG
jgi:hypothetical protein